jgi:hypothetical protein
LAKPCASTQGWSNVAGACHTQQRDCYIAQTGHFALDAKTLCDMRKSKIIIEFRAGPNMAQFQTAMGFIGGGVCRGEKR